MRTAGAVAKALRFQRDAAVTSPLYRHVLDVLLADVEAGGPCDRVLAGVDPALDPVADAVPLRLLGALHQLVLQGEAPALAAWYPTAGGTADPAGPGLAEVLLATIADHAEALAAGLGRPVQTNEVGRSASLLPGFLAVAATTGLPLRVLEVGASAGLNLRWDHYRYEGGAGGTAWGDPAASVCFRDAYVEPRPRLDGVATVVERAGCDARPIDPTSAAGRLALQAFVWPDQPERHALLAAALTVAATVPAAVTRADAAEWVADRLAAPEPGAATVVVHSIVWQYLPPDTRRRILAVLDRAGRRATPRAPLAWLRMEPGADFASRAEVRLTTWPGGHEQLVAYSGYHGRPVQLATG